MVDPSVPLKIITSSQLLSWQQANFVTGFFAGLANRGLLRGFAGLNPSPRHKEVFLAACGIDGIKAKNFIFMNHNDARPVPVNFLLAKVFVILAALLKKILK